MRRPRKALRVRTEGLREGEPRVVEDVELYHAISQMAKEKQGPAEIKEYVRLWSSPWQDWQLAVMALRAQLVHGAMRAELGRRTQLDPNQLRLMKGV